MRKHAFHTCRVRYVEQSWEERFMTGVPKTSSFTQEQSSTLAPSSTARNIVILACHFWLYHRSHHCLLLFLQVTLCSWQEVNERLLLLKQQQQQQQRILVNVASLMSFANSIRNKGISLNGEKALPRPCVADRKSTNVFFCWSSSSSSNCKESWWT